MNDLRILRDDVIKCTKCHAITEYCDSGLSEVITPVPCMLFNHQKAIEKNSILMIVDSVTLDAQLSDTPLELNQIHMARSVFYEAGIDTNRLIITNTVKCHIHNKHKPFNNCRYWLIKEIETINPKFIIVAGIKTMSMLLNNYKLKPKCFNTYQIDSITQQNVGCIPSMGILFSHNQLKLGTIAFIKRYCDNAEIA